MEIKLIIKDKEKTFVAGRPMGRIVRNAIEIMSKINLNNIGGEELDMIIDFTVDAYGKQFTRDQVYDGLYADELLSEMLKTISSITGATVEKLETKNE